VHSKYLDTFLWLAEMFCSCSNVWGALKVQKYQMALEEYFNCTLTTFTRGSAMAEGPRDALVSRNSATTKHPIWKLESRAYRVALFSRFHKYRSVTDTHTLSQTDRRTDMTTTACTALSIASCSKNRPYCTAHQVGPIITRQRASVDSKLVRRPRNVSY